MGSFHDQISGFFHIMDSTVSQDKQGMEHSQTQVLVDVANQGFEYPVEISRSTETGAFEGCFVAFK